MRIGSKNRICKSLTQFKKNWTHLETLIYNTFHQQSFFKASNCIAMKIHIYSLIVATATPYALANNIRGSNSLVRETNPLDRLLPLNRILDEEDDIVVEEDDFVDLNVTDISEDVDVSVALDIDIVVATAAPKPKKSEGDKSSKSKLVKSSKSGKSEKSDKSGKSSKSTKVKSKKPNVEKSEKSKLVKSGKSS